MITVDPEQENYGAGCDGTPVIATLGQLRQESLSTSYSQFKVSWPYLAVCWGKGVPALIHVSVKRSNKQLSQNECPEEEQGEQFGEGRG